MKFNFEPTCYANKGDVSSLTSLIAHFYSKSLGDYWPQERKFERLGELV